MHRRLWGDQMNYMKVKWRHSAPDDPVLLYSELDALRWETRKVEVFADGHSTYASTAQSVGSTRLGEMRVPPLTEIASDPQFEPVEISKDEFEQAWKRANADS
jgi:hypothetical protein